MRNSRATAAAVIGVALLASLCVLACGSSSSPRVGTSSQASRDLAKYAWAVGLHGTILATADGGAHWEAQKSGTSKSLYGVAFPDASHGWAVGDAGILTTSDGGTHWQLQKPETGLALGGVAFPDVTHG